MLDSRYAMWMLWGPDLTFFCNDAYLPTVGIKRDWVLGTRSDKVWEEICPDIGPRISQVLEHGHATWDEALLLPELRETRLIAVSGYGQPQDRERARAAGFDEHLIKPVSSASVARAIAGIAQSGRQPMGAAGFPAG